jgi:hypothetical protein
MGTQLRLLDGDGARSWRLDARQRRVGRDGIAAARRALEQARIPEPAKELRRAG